MDLQQILKQSIYGEISEKIFNFYSDFIKAYPQNDLINPRLYSLDFQYGMNQMNQNFKNISIFLQNKESELLKNSYLMLDVGSIFLNFNAFLSTIQMLGTPEQVQFWEQQIFSCQIIGAYSQTEMAHGSDVQSLQTTAIYDEKTDSFIINTPNVKDSKYWPGLLGKQSTHTVLQARTYSNGEYLGIQTFVIPLRDLKNNMKALDGLEIGEIGAKMGFMLVDNGYLFIKNLKVPRDNMLMRYLQIEKGGKTKKKEKKNEKLAYGSMLNLRVILSSTFCYGSITSTILAYYHNTNNVEQKKLFFSEIISRNFTLLISTQEMKNIYKQYQNQVSLEDKQMFKTLQIIHALSSGFKALTSAVQINDVRENLTKNDKIGSLFNSGQSLMYSDAIPAVTYEGDNSVLLQQTGKFVLLLEFQRQQEKPLGEYFQFLEKGKTRNCYLEELLNIQMQKVSKEVFGQENLTLKQTKIIELAKLFTQVMNIRLSQKYFNNQSLESKCQSTFQTLLQINLLLVIEQYKENIIAYGIVQREKVEQILEQKQTLINNLDAEYFIQQFPLQKKQPYIKLKLDLFEEETVHINKAIEDCLKNQNHNNINNFISRL